MQNYELLSYPYRKSNQNRATASRNRAHSNRQRTCKRIHLGRRPHNRTESIPKPDLRNDLHQPEARYSPNAPPPPQSIKVHRGDEVTERMEGLEKIIIFQFTYRRG